MTFIILGVCLFVGFLFLFLVLMPRPSAAGALLEQATRTNRVTNEVPVWRTALNVDYLARPFTLVRRVFSPEPDPALDRRLTLPGCTPSARSSSFFRVP